MGAKFIIAVVVVVVVVELLLYIYFYISDYIFFLNFGVEDCINDCCYGQTSFLFVFVNYPSSFITYPKKSSIFIWYHPFSIFDSNAVKFL